MSKTTKEQRERDREQVNDLRMQCGPMERTHMRVRCDAMIDYIDDADALDAAEKRVEYLEELCGELSVDSDDPAARGMDESYTKLRHNRKAAEQRAKKAEGKLAELLRGLNAELANYRACKRAGTPESADRIPPSNIEDLLTRLKGR